MDTAVTASDGGWTLCWECLDAGCTPVPHSPAEPVGSDYECQRGDAYNN